MFGSQGDDVLFGDQGIDTLIGGSGSDTFVVQNNGSADFILDFDAAVDQLAFEGGLTLADVSFVSVAADRVEVRDASGLALAILDGNPLGVLTTGNVQEDPIPPLPAPAAASPSSTPPPTTIVVPGVTPTTPTPTTPTPTTPTSPLPGISEDPALDPAFLL